MAIYAPKTHLRDVSINPLQTAFLIIDLQNASFIPEGVLYESEGHFFEQSSLLIKNVQDLQKACRLAKIEIVYTVMECLTLDCRDNSLDYDISGFKFPKGCLDAKIIHDLQPLNDEIIFSKSSCDVFSSTNIDYVLKNMNMKQLIVAGVMTDQCVESAVRHACDLGYLVTLVSDGCLTTSKEEHENSLRAIKGFCRQLTTKDLLAEITKSNSI